MNVPIHRLSQAGTALLLVAAAGLAACATGTTFEERARHVLTSFENDLVRARKALDGLEKECQAIDGLGEGAQQILAAECKSLADRIEAAEKERVRLHATPDEAGIETLYANSMAIYHGISRVHQLRIFAEAAVKK